MTDGPAVAFRDHMRWLSDLSRQIQAERARADRWRQCAVGTWWAVVLAVLFAWGWGR